MRVYQVLSGGSVASETVPILTATTVSASSSATFENLPPDCAVVLKWTGTPTGTNPRLLISAQHLSPDGSSTAVSAVENLISIDDKTVTDNWGHGTVALPLRPLTGAVKLTWTVYGTTPVFPNISLWLVKCVGVAERATWFYNDVTDRGDDSNISYSIVNRAAGRVAVTVSVGAKSGSPTLTLTNRDISGFLSKASDSVPLSVGTNTYFYDAPGTQLDLDLGGIAGVGGSVSSLTVTVADCPATPANSEDTLPISAVSLPLPTGAATAARQDTGNTALSSILTALGDITTPADTQPVSGTFWQATQPVSAAALPLPTGAATSALQTQPGVDIGDVTINNAAGAAAVNIQDGGNSITVDAASLPLPTGASTAAKQPALGTAGTASADVITVQGIASMTALSVAQATASSLNAQVVGSVAHGAGDGGNPVKIGFYAVNALPTAEANADRVNGIADLWGRQLTASIDPAMQVHKTYNTTSQQTGADVWTPASGKKIAITSVVIGTYGTTAARLILWFGDNADTTYSAGTDQVLVAASFAPSATVKPGLVLTPPTPIFCTTADRELHITTDAALSVDITLYGYEW